MSNNVIFNIDTSLFYWTVIAYFLLLYHSFDIKEVQNKIRGVELLFVSVALGTLLSVISEYLFSPSLNLIYNWFIDWKIAKGLSFTFNPFQRYLHEPLTTQMEYFAFGVFFAFFLYVAFVYLTTIIIKLIQKILDPHNEIYPKYRRFSIFTENKVPEIVIWGFPRLLSSIGVLILVIGLIVGYISNIMEIDSGFKGIFQIILALAFSGLMIFILGVFLHITYYDYRLISPIIHKIILKIKEIRNNNLKKQREHINTKKIDMFFTKYMNINVYLIILFLISFSITEYLVYQISFVEMMLMLISSGVMLLLIYIYKK